MKFYYQIKGSIEVDDYELEKARSIAKAHLQVCCKELPSAELRSVQTKEEQEGGHI